MEDNSRVTVLTKVIDQGNKIIHQSDQANGLKDDSIFSAREMIKSRMKLDKIQKLTSGISKLNYASIPSKQVRGND